jgi:hypothetical protein
VLNGNRSADLAHGETPPPLVGGETHADAIYTGPKSNLIRREGNEETKYKETYKLLLCPPDLHPLLYTLLLWPIQMLLVKLINQISGTLKVFR